MNTREVFVDSIYAGMCIALGGFASVGLAKPFNGIIFSAGLVMIIFLGLQLFTGNILRAKEGFSWEMLWKFWGLVYLGNFVGCFLSAWVVILSGFPLEATAAIANTKAALPFMEAFWRGIFCNVLVCIAAYLGKSIKAPTAGKILIIMLPVTLFVISGYEHSVADMFYFSVGKTSLFNLIPVTLGNIIGGLLVVLCIKNKTQETPVQQVEIVKEKELVG